MRAVINVGTMPTISPLLALCRSDPSAARDQILAALTRADGNRSRAAAALGVNRGLLIRCAESCGALPAMAARWPGSEHGGGVRSAEHVARLRANLAAARAKKSSAKALVSKGI